MKFLLKFSLIIRKNELSLIYNQSEMKNLEKSTIRAKCSWIARNKLTHPITTRNLCLWFDLWPIEGRKLLQELQDAGLIEFASVYPLKREKGSITVTTYKLA